MVAILAILASIAVPSYMESVRKSKRADARGALLGLSGAMERFFTENNSYCGSDIGGTIGTCVADDSPGIFSNQVPVDGGSAYYDLTISAVTTTSYTLTATRTGSMTGDARCGDYTLDSVGAQGFDGTGVADYCLR